MGWNWIEEGLPVISWKQEWSQATNCKPFIASSSLRDVKFPNKCWLSIKVGRRIGFAEVCTHGTTLWAYDDLNANYIKTNVVDRPLVHFTAKRFCYSILVPWMMTKRPVDQHIIAGKIWK